MALDTGGSALAISRLCHSPLPAIGEGTVVGAKGLWRAPSAGMLLLSSAEAESDGSGR